MNIDPLGSFSFKFNLGFKSYVKGTIGWRNIKISYNLTSGFFLIPLLRGIKKIY